MHNIFVVNKRPKIRETIVDSIFREVNFTMELEKDCELAFLGVLVRRNAGGGGDKIVPQSNIKLP